MILIALGANINSIAGEPAVTLTRALDAMSAQGIRVINVSAFYKTPAWPDPTDPPFVNAVAKIETSRNPQQLLDFLHAIEAQFGRQRLRSNAPRTLDIDLLDYEGRVETDWPILPHPRIADRAFVLVPLKDVAPNWRHPVTNMPLQMLLEALNPDEKKAVLRLNY